MRAWVLFALVVATTGCGGSPVTSPTTPTPTIPTPTPSPGGLTFDVDTGVSASDEAVIKQYLAFARDYLTRQFQWELPASYRVSIKVGDAGSITATAGATGMTVYAGSPSWIDTATRPNYRQKIILHELFHTLQATTWALTPSLTWLIEGSAEYVGFQGALVEPGYFSAARVRACAIYDVLLHVSTPLGPLASFESTIGSQGQAYNLFYLAVERLTEGQGLGSLRRVGSFDSSFGRSVSAFYTDFEQYRASWQPPLRFDCYD